MKSTPSKSREKSAIAVSLVVYGMLLGLALATIATVALLIALNIRLL